MTIFGCESCSCDCPAPCSFIEANCFEISFSGFSDPVDPNYSCTICNTIGDHTIIVKRGDTNTLRARATAVRPSAAVEGDEDAEFSVTLTRDEKTDAYTVSSISIVSGGSGYVPGTKIEFEYGYVFTYEGQEIFQPAGAVRCDRYPFAWITSFGRAEPDIEASLACGPELSVTLSESTDDDGEPIWSVDSVSVESGGFECQDGAAVSFTAPASVTVVTPAAGIVRTGRSEPTLRITLNGSEAFASVTMTESQDFDGRSVWGVQAVESLFVFDGPTPQPGDSISFVPPEGTVEVSAASAVVQSVEDFFGFPNVTVSVTSPGTYYADTGVIESVEVTEAGEYYTTGAITGVALVKGGEIYNDFSGSACVFNGRICGSCPTDRGQEIIGRIDFATNLNNELEATLRINFIESFTDQLTVTATGFAPDATSITFSDLSNQSLCATAGSITITAVDCDAPPQSPCDPMPKQIEVTFSGLGGAAVLRSIEPDEYPPQQAAANGLCGTTTDAQCFVRSRNLSVGDFGTGSESVGEDAAIIFELDEGLSSCREYVYRGDLPLWQYQDPEPSGLNGARCLSSPSDIIIGKTGCGITVYAIRQESPSTKNALCPIDDTCPRGDFLVNDAVLQVTGTAAGAITGIAVIAPGTCYAWRVFTYSEPQATAVAPTVLGSGATFTIEWEQYQNDDGDDRWRVVAVTGEGGEGYIDGDGVFLELEDGSCGFGYAGSIITKRLEPQPTLTLPSPGSGGEISYTLAAVNPPSCLRQFGIQSVAVSQAGTGYKDGSPVTVSLSAGGEVVQDAVITLVVERTEPQVTATVGTATLTVTLAESEDLAGKPTWGVASVAIDNGGSGGLSNGDTITFSVTADENIIPPFATIEVDESGIVTAVNVIVPGQFYNDTGPIDDAVIEDQGYYCGPDENVAPSFTFGLTGGQSGELSAVVYTRRIIPCYEAWEFSSVTVDTAGTGYKDRSPIAITLEQESGGGVEEIPASLLVRVTRTEPVVTATVGNATLTVTLFQLTDFFGDAFWTVSSVGITEAGSGIASGDTVSFTIDEGTINLAPTAYVEVDENGSVTAVIVQFGGELVDDIGPIASIEIEQAGQYWTTDSSIGCVVTESEGAYYKATPSGVESSAPVIRLQTPCGTGATAEAVVDVDPGSATFGGIAEVTVTDGGEGYFPLGDAWILTASYGGLNSSALRHMTDPGPGGPNFGTYPNPDADGEPGPSGLGYLGNDFLHNAYEPLSARISMLCPADLLTRDYRMWWYSRYGGPLQDADDNECGKYFQSLDGCIGCIFGIDYLTTSVRRFGDEDIKISISPVVPE